MLRFSFYFFVIRSNLLPTHKYTQLYLKNYAPIPANLGGFANVFR